MANGDTPTRAGAAMSRLDEIVASKRREIEALVRTPDAPLAPTGPADTLRSRRASLDVRAALARSEGAPLRLIAEVKMKSPSAGPLSRALDAASRARVYADAGATMVSILCDGPFFDGSFEDLARARAALDTAGLAVPLLAKEFILDAVQLDRARDSGADAALLIARILPPPALSNLASACRARGLEPLIEVTDEAELAAALAAGARVVGVNARDLDTLVIDKARAARVLAAIPADVVAVHLSGLSTPASVADVAAGRADAALVGEALMRQDAPGELLRAMVTAAKT